MTAKELNEVPIHFIHSLNRSGNYNLPSTKLRSGEKKTLHLKMLNPMGTGHYMHTLSWATPSASIELEWGSRDQLRAMTETGYQLTPDVHPPSL